MVHPSVHAFDVDTWVVERGFAPNPIKTKKFDKLSRNDGVDTKFIISAQA
jgi:hypothetical protein